MEDQTVNKQPMTEPQTAVNKSKINENFSNADRTWNIPKTFKIKFWFF